MHIGSSCIKDFTGHTPTSVLGWWRKLRELIDEFPGRVHDSVLTEQFVTLAAAAVRQDGFVARSATGRSTDDRIWDTIYRDPKHEDDWITGVIGEDAATARSAIDWARDLSASSDFNRNLRVTAAREIVERHRSGLAAYIVAAYLRHLGMEIARRKARAEKSPTPDGDGPHAVSGTVLRTTWQENYFCHYAVGSVKATIRDDRGFTVWGTVPSSAPVPEHGDRVRLICSSIVRSDQDECFGFFKRPRRWEVLEVAKASDRDKVAATA